MKLTVEVAQLNSLLSRVTRVVDGNFASGHMLLVVHDGKLTATATNMEMLVSGGVPADVAEEGSISVPGERLGAIVASLPDGAQVSMALTDERLIVRSGRSRFSLTTLAADTFSNWGVDDMPESFKIGAITFAEILAFALPFVSDDKSRYSLLGVNLHDIDRRAIRAVAADGYCLGHADVGVEIASPSVNCLISVASIKEIKSLLDKAEGEICVSATDRKMQLAFPDGLIFVCKLIDAIFPDYRRMILASLADNDKIINVDGKALTAMMTRLRSMSKDAKSTVRFQIHDRALKATVRHPDHGDAEDEIECEYEGDKIVIGFSIALIVEALSLLKADTMQFSVGELTRVRVADGPEQTGYRPTLWRAVGNDARIIVIAPRVGDV